MRKFLLSLVVVSAVVLGITAAPTTANARWRGGWGSAYYAYPAYYAPMGYSYAYSYPTYYTPAYTSYYTPVYSSAYYAPTYSSYYTPAYTSYYTPAYTSYYTPTYSSYYYSPGMAVWP